MFAHTFPITFVIIRKSG